MAKPNIYFFGGKAITAKEYAKERGIGVHHARVELNKLVKEGKVTVARPVVAISEDDWIDKLQ